MFHYLSLNDNDDYAEDNNSDKTDDDGDDATSSSWWDDYHDAYPVPVLPYSSTTKTNSYNQKHIV